MSLKDLILRRKPVEAVAMISKVEHDGIVRAMQAEIDGRSHDVRMAERAYNEARIQLIRLRDERNRRLAPLMAANAARKEAAAAKRKAKGGENGHG